MDHENCARRRITFGVHCLNIRHKGMYLSLDPNVDPDMNNELFNSGCYWCAVRRKPASVRMASRFAQTSARASAPAAHTREVVKG